jgi:hypothetical protein
MNIVETLLGSGGGVVNQLATQFGITSDQATSAASALVPALAGGIKDKLASGNAGLTNLLTGGGLSTYADNPASLSTPGALEQGQRLVSSIFGSGDTTTKLISTVAEKCGIGEGIISKMLPIAATLLGGSIAKNVAQGGNLTDVVGQFADAGQGGILGAVKGLAAKVLG